MSPNIRPTVLLVAVFIIAFADSAHAQRRTAFDNWDTNGDGYVSRDEFPSRLGRATFDRVDTDNDGRLSRKEDEAYRRNRNRQRPQNQLPEGVAVQRDITYASVGDRKLPLDLYLPKQGDRPLPLVIWIHGGGWKGGSKNGISRARRLLEHGYAVASVEYRLSGEAIFPAAVEDCKAAVSFLRLHADRHGIDPKRFGAFGSSAGGHLVAMLGVLSDSDDFESHPVCRQAESHVQAVCNWFGPTDFLRMNDFPGKIDHDASGSPESLFIGAPIQQHQDKVALANPMTYVTAADPPMLLMHGEKDQSVPYNQSELLFASLQKAGVEAQLYKVVGGDHGFRGSVDTPEALDKMVVEFFDAKLKR